MDGYKTFRSDRIIWLKHAKQVITSFALEFSTSFQIILFVHRNHILKLIVVILREIPLWHSIGFISLP